MRDRRRTPLPSVLALTFATLLALPIATSAASGLPATITMQPDAAGPGAVVQVVGIDFPGSQRVELQLTSTAGPVPLATTTTEAGGYFRQQVALPVDIAPGFWELRATGSDGTVAVHIFEAGPAVAGAVAPDPGGATVAAAAGSGPSEANLLVLLVLLTLVGAIGGTAAFVYYQLHRPVGDPGMAAGDDPIWAGAPSDT